MRRALAPLAGALALLAASAPASAATRASVRLAFAPDRLGARTALTFSARLSGGEEGVPAPLRSLTVHLPAGLGVDLRGVASCAPARVRRGARACPRGSSVGRGQATMVAHAGSQTIEEQASLSAFRIPDQHGRPALAILGVGLTPLTERIVSRGVLLADRPPYGSKLVVTIPAIPTLPLEPDASFLSLSLTIGAASAPRAHAAGAAITVPRRCPQGGFPFAADMRFADASTTAATATVRCP